MQEALESSNHEAVEQRAFRGHASLPEGVEVLDEPEIVPIVSGPGEQRVHDGPLDLTLPVPVDDPADDNDRARLQHERHDGPCIFEMHSYRERVTPVTPGTDPEELVACRGGVDERRSLGCGLESTRSRGESFRPVVLGRLREGLHPSDRDIGVIISFQCGDELLVRIGGEHVIRVEKPYERRSHRVKSGVPRRPEPTIGLLNEPHVGVAPSICPRNLRAGVLTAVLDKHDLEVGEDRLAHDAVQALLEVVLDVVDGHDHRGARRRGERIKQWAFLVGRFESRRSLVQRSNRDGAGNNSPRKFCTKPSSIGVAPGTGASFTQIASRSRFSAKPLNTGTKESSRTLR